MISESGLPFIGIGAPGEKRGRKNAARLDGSTTPRAASSRQARCVTEGGRRRPRRERMALTAGADTRDRSPSLTRSSLPARTQL